jgi:hypothetical protein
MTWGQWIMNSEFIGVVAISLIGLVVTLSSQDMTTERQNLDWQHYPSPHTLPGNSPGLEPFLAEEPFIELSRHGQLGFILNTVGLNLEI